MYQILGIQFAGCSPRGVNLEINGGGSAVTTTICPALKVAAGRVKPDELRGADDRHVAETVTNFGQPVSDVLRKFRLQEQLLRLPLVMESGRHDGLLRIHAKINCIDQAVKHRGNDHGAHR